MRFWLTVTAFLAATASSIASANTCELNVWAEGRAAGPASDPHTISAEQRSTPGNLLDAGQRLHEMDPAQLVQLLKLPSDTRVIIHTERQLLGKEAEQANTRLNTSNASCYFDWTFRPDATFGPTPGGRANINAFVITNYGTISFYSIFKAYGRDNAPYLSVKGVHPGRLPVLSKPDQKPLVYDTEHATRELIENAVRKIEGKLNGRSLTQGY